MRRREWSEVQRGKIERPRSGYTSLRITKATRNLIDRLQERTRYNYSGADDLLYELLRVELARTLGEDEV